MPSKFDSVTGNLPKWVDDTPGQQDKVNALVLQIMAGPEADGVTLPFNLSAEIEERVLSIRAEIELLNKVLIHASGGKFSSAALARAYRDVRKVKDEMEKAEKFTNLLIKAYEQLFANQAEADGIEAVPLTDGDRIGVLYEPHAKVVDRDAFREWCIENGYERELNLAWGTTNNLAKDATMKGKKIPGIEVSAKPKFSWR